MLEVALMAFTGVVGALAGYYVTQEKWHKECIRHGYAQYNPQTGAWEWLDMSLHTADFDATTSVRSSD